MRGSGGAEAHRAAAVEDQDLAVDEAGGRVGEEGDGVSHVPGFGQAPAGVAGGCLPEPLCGKLVQQGGADRSGGDGVDRDLAAGVLGDQGAGQPCDGRLGRDVVRVAGRAQVGPRPDVDDLAPSGIFVSAAWVTASRPITLTCQTRSMSAAVMSASGI